MDKSQPPSPWNPSVRVTARVTGALPAPDACPHCASKVELVNNAAIYGRSYGEWPWAYRCTNCDAYVGLHPFTAIPLGTLATKPIREARKKAKAVFSPLWRSGKGSMSRSNAYAWLAGALGIAKVEECHIGWFGVEQCEAVVKAVESRANLKRDAVKQAR